jgi:hypothetical protein
MSGRPRSRGARALTPGLSPPQRGTTPPPALHTLRPKFAARCGFEHPRSGLRTGLGSEVDHVASVVSVTGPSATGSAKRAAAMIAVRRPALVRQGPRQVRALALRAQVRRRGGFRRAGPCEGPGRQRARGSGLGRAGAGHHGEPPRVRAHGAVAQLRWRMAWKGVAPRGSWRTVAGPD